MSDPNMDMADAYTDWQSEVYEEMKAAFDASEKDAKLYGTGIIQITWPGPKYKSISPRYVLFAPEASKDEKK